MAYQIGETVFNDWKIVRRIGSGASGTVYEIRKQAQKVDLNAALKVMQVPQDPSVVESLRSDGMSEEAVSAYLQGIVNELIEEVKMMTSLKGFPYIVSCEDYQEIKDPDSLKWDILIRMELLTPLQDYQKSHDFTEADVHTMAVHMAKALQLFEEHHIVHRDIKPENIFVNPYGDFKVGDFGIATAVDKAAGELSRKGTENYMAPEVYRGQEYDSTVDIYSLGLVLYRTLNNNRLPFYPLNRDYTEMDREQAMVHRMSGKKVLQAPAAASEEFSAIILKMCSFRPEERYQNASQLLRDLESFTPSDTVVLPAYEAKAVIEKEQKDVRNQTTPIFGTKMTKGTVGKAAAAGIAGAGLAGAAGKKASASEGGSVSVSPESGVQEAEKAASGGQVRETAKTDPGQAVSPADGNTSADAASDPDKHEQAEAASSAGGKNESGTASGSKTVGKKAAGAAAAGNRTVGSKTAGSKTSGNKTAGNTTAGSRNTDSGSRGGSAGGAGFSDISAADEDESSSGSKKRKLIIQGIVALVILLGILIPLLLSRKFRLDVVGGSGEGTYKGGAEVKVTAGTVEGSSFTSWEAEGITLSEKDASSREITIKMPRRHVTLTALYQENLYDVTVRGGTGSGQYKMNETVAIKADEPEEGYAFARWNVKNGSVQIADENAAETTFEMGQNSVDISAVFEPNHYELKVNNADGSASVAYGETVRLTAEEKDYSIFQGWQVVKGTLPLTEEELQKMEIRFTMPAEEVELTAVYKINEHTLTVVGGTGSGTYEVGEKVTLNINDPEEGYTFKGWKVTIGNASLSNTGAIRTTMVMPDEDVEVTAQFDALVFKLTVNDSAGTGSYSYGDEIKLEAQEVSGSSFTGWTLVEGPLELTPEELEQPVLNFTMPAGDVELTAEYSVNVHTLTVVGGTGGGTYAVGDKVSLKADPAGEGHVFAGWQVTSGEVSLKNASSQKASLTMPDEDIEVTAKYTPLDYQLTVNEAAGGGTYTYGSEVRLTADEVSEYTFTGWTVVDGPLELTKEQQAAQTLTFSMPAGDVEITAEYEINKHTLTVESGSGSGTVEVGKKVTVKADKPKAGYEFSSWKVLDGNVTLKDSNATQTTLIMPDEDVTISALYTELDYQLVVNGADGSGSYTYGKAVRLIAGEVSGKTFSHWTVVSGDLELDEKAAASQDLRFEMPASDVEITAEYVVNKHRVTVTNGSGSGVFDTGSTVQISAQKAAIGYEFSTWKVTSGTVTLKDAASEKTSFTMPDENVQLAAEYVKTAYKVTVNNGQGSGDYYYKDSVTISASPMKDGMTFSGWTVDKGGLKFQDPSVLSITFSMPAKEVTLTAHYSITKYTVKVINGTGNGKFAAGEDVTVTAPAVNEEGKKFSTWKVVSGDVKLGNIDLTETSITFMMPKSNVTIQADYSSEEYSLTVNGGSGSGNYAPGDTITIKADKAQSGMKFSYWMIQNEGESPVFETSEELTMTMPQNNVIATAVYETQW